MTSFRERIDGGEFTNKLDYPVTGSIKADRLRAAYRVEDGRLKELFKAELLKELGLTDHPAADRFWVQCWEDGHSSGFAEVYNVAMNWADILKPVVASDDLREFAATLCDKYGYDQNATILRGKTENMHIIGLSNHDEKHARFILELATAVMLRYRKEAVS